MDNIRDSLDSVAAWIDERIHDGWYYSYPSCNRYRCCDYTPYSGAKTRIIIIAKMLNQYIMPCNIVLKCYGMSVVYNN